MEADERPAKVRKLEVSAESEAVISSSQPVSDTTLSNDHKSLTNTANKMTCSAVEHEDDADSDAQAEIQAGGNIAESHQPLSKNQMKKIRRKEAWEAGRGYRKAKRKEKMQAKKARKQAEREDQAQLEQDNLNLQKVRPRPPRHRRPTCLPVTIIVDCGFDELMVEKERISLGSQLTRAYSDVHKAPYQAHLYISSWSGLLKQRFDTVLSGNYRNWKNIEFTEQDFVGASEQARAVMRGKRGGKMVGAFEKYATEEPPLDRIDTIDSTSASEPVNAKVDNLDSHPEVHEDVQTNGDVSMGPNQPPPFESPRDIIYLTSESPHTLTSLEPYHTYVVGGLVDKNRHKGICYKTARDRNIRTAKLPIAEYMDMTSRFVLATNHVVEIMLKWLELGDWAQAFMAVMPKRKGGRLKETEASERDGSADRSEDLERSVSHDDDGGSDHHSNSVLDGLGENGAVEAINSPTQRNPLTDAVNEV